MAYVWKEGGDNVPSITKIESDYLYDVRDPKWAHPELADTWLNSASSAPLYDPSCTVEENQAKGEATLDAIFKQMGATKGKLADETCDVTTYTVPGCPEEPETSVEVLVYRPKTLKSKKAKCMFYILSGALVMKAPELYPISYFACQYNCVCVVADYRESFKARYPGAINDCHAAYTWMLDNAEMLQINPKKVMIYGASSGGHLALSLAFRLKRYGVPAPRGLVTYVPQVDDRESDSVADRVYTGLWDSVDHHNALLQYAGPANFGTSRLGPEYIANHATIEDCIGYPPTTIITVEFDPDRANCEAFYHKLAEAKTYCNFYAFAGAHHVSDQLIGTNLPGEPNEYGKVIKVVLDKAINDCFDYDLSRPWVTEK